MKVQMIDGGYHVSVDHQEAIEIIESLSAQILAENPNVGRKEFSNPYFSISVCRKVKE